MPEPEKQTQKGRAIGIDLGTTNSVMMQRGRTIEVIESRENEDHVPSVVGYFRNEIIIGRPAVNNAASAPENTIFSIKRLMGRGYRDEEVQHAMKRMKYKIVIPSNSTEDDVRVILGGKEYSPVEISAKILKKMKEDAETKCGGPVTHAVITVPAYFMENHKRATALAGHQAGFQVSTILDEPTAAAIAYGVNNVLPDEARQILVYDLGGGTFDVSVLMIAGGAFAQLSVDGDLWLGGDDFDAKIMDYVLDSVQKEHGIDGKSNARFMVTLKQACEKAKIMLSSAKKAEIMVAGLLRDKTNEIIDVYVELSRDQFNSMIAGDIRRSIEIVKRAISTAKLTKDQIDSVLLVGGSTNIPYVQEALTEFFGKEKILRDVNPMLCVAQGAAILATQSPYLICPKCLEKNDSDAVTCKKCSFDISTVEEETEISVPRVTGYDYGIELADNSFSVIIPKGTSLPSDPVTKQYFPNADDLTRINIPVFAQDENKKRSRMGIVWVHLPPGTTTSTPVFITLSFGADGIIRKAIVDVQRNDVNRVEVDLDHGDGWVSKIEQSLQDVEKQAQGKRETGAATVADIHDIRSRINDITRLAMENREREANELLGKLKETIQKLGQLDPADKDLRHAQFICVWTKTALNRYGSLVGSPDEHLKLSRMAEELDAAINRGDKKRMGELAGELDVITNKNKAIVLLMNTLFYEEELKPYPSDQNLLMTKRSEVENALAQNDIKLFETKFSELLSLYASLKQKYPPTDPNNPDPYDDGPKRIGGVSVGRVLTTDHYHAKK
jgi:molecular chaperone DnaK